MAWHVRPFAATICIFKLFNYAKQSILIDIFSKNYRMRYAGDCKLMFEVFMFRRMIFLILCMTAQCAMGARKEMTQEERKKGARHFLAVGISLRGIGGLTLDDAMQDTLDLCYDIDINDVKGVEQFKTVCKGLVPEKEVEKFIGVAQKQVKREKQMQAFVDKAMNHYFKESASETKLADYIWKEYPHFGENCVVTKDNLTHFHDMFKTLWIFILGEKYSEKAEKYCRGLVLERSVLSQKKALEELKNANLQREADNKKKNEQERVQNEEKSALQAAVDQAKIAALEEEAARKNQNKAEGKAGGLKETIIPWYTNYVQVGIPVMVIGLTGIACYVYLSHSASSEKETADDSAA